MPSFAALPLSMQGHLLVLAQRAEQVPGEREGFGSWPLMIIIGVFLLLVGLVIMVMFWNYLRLWFQAFVSNVTLNPLSLIGMSLRQVNPKTIIEAKITAMQAGVGTDPATGITTRRLEAHYLAGARPPRDPCHHRGPPGRHRPRLRPGRRHRPGGARRPRRRPDER
jgi:hypothetical protein